MAADRVLVTGGRGFVGAAAVRRLLAGGTPVSILTRDASRVPADWAGRVEVVDGDLDASDNIARALSACAIVVHAARSDDPDPRRRHALDVAGTTRLLDRAIAAGVRRFIYISTISVYPVVADGRIDETWPYGDAPDEYSRSKRECEAAVLARAAEIDVVILQLANVYGPGRNWWSGDLADLMRAGRVILVNGGDGTANMIHVDDVAAAIALVVGGRGVTGARYLLTDGRPRPWREYFAELERVVGHRATVAMSVDDAKRYSHRVRESSWMARAARAFARTIAGQPPIFPMDDDAIDRFASRAVFSNECAIRELGFVPDVTDFAGRV